jgi:hypothetical protein
MSAEKSYTERIRAVYQDRVYRLALFETLAELTRSPERREKWRVLLELQLETKLRIRPILERQGLETAEDPARRSRGRRHGRVLAHRRWMEFMDSLLAEVSRTIGGLEEIERLAPRLDAPTLGRATATEVALQSFARLELAGRGAESVGPALALLEDARRAPALAAGQG